MMIKRFFFKIRLVKPLNQISDDALEAEIDLLLELLGENLIAVDFVGEWELATAYLYLIQVVLEEAIVDVSANGFCTHFTPCSPEYGILFEWRPILLMMKIHFGRRDGRLFWRT